MEHVPKCSQQQQQQQHKRGGCRLVQEGLVDVQTPLCVLNSKWHSSYHPPNT